MRPSKITFIAGGVTEILLTPLWYRIVSWPTTIAPLKGSGMGIIRHAVASIFSSFQGSCSILRKKAIILRIYIAKVEYLQF
jgi:hypothetical protein